jgi:hypothetical protein
MPKTNLASMSVDALLNFLARRGGLGGREVARTEDQRRDVDVVVALTGKIFGAGEGIRTLDPNPTCSSRQSSCSRV